MKVRFGEAQRVDGIGEVGDIVERIADRSARGIAGAMSRMITDGTFAPGSRLPTVRAFAHSLGVSPTTVGEAWLALRRSGGIETRGRIGTVVVGRPGLVVPQRYRDIAEGHGHFAMDLSAGTPDPDLLADLGPLLARVSRQTLTTSYLDNPVIPQLDEVLRARWPFPPEALTVVDGAMDALDRIATQVIRFGDRVLVENPAFPPLLDLLEQLGAETIGLAMDDEGIVPSALAATLPLQPVALFLQPRAHNPTGWSMTPSRAEQLASLLRDRPLTIIEDDHAGDIALSPPVSLGRWLPSWTVHIQGFSKSHGPDLRLAAVGGAAGPIERAVTRRLLGPGWSSRLLQMVLFELLTDPAALDRIADAAQAYADRRARVVAALAARGVTTTGTDGINLWVEVAQERSALVTLASRGIGVAPGTPFLVSPLANDHVRITISSIRGDITPLIDHLATAAAAGHRRNTRVRR